MTDKKYLAEQIAMTSGVDVRKCMMCGKCSASCPSYDEMEYHPHQFVKMVESGDIEPLLESESLYHCLTCFACVDRCPRGVKPANVVEAVRLAAVRRKGGNHLPPDRLPELLDEDIPGQALVSAMRKYVK
ncbi:MAG: 4Fe-4S dicluster domain-containing protein [Christensenellales bacterium]